MQEIITPYNCQGWRQAVLLQVAQPHTLPPLRATDWMQKRIPHEQQRERGGRRVLSALGFPFTPATLHFQPSKGLFMNVINSPLPGSPLEEKGGSEHKSERLGKGCSYSARSFHSYQCPFTAAECEIHHGE